MTVFDEHAYAVITSNGGFTLLGVARSRDESCEQRGFSPAAARSIARSLNESADFLDPQGAQQPGSDLRESVQRLRDVAASAACVSAGFAAATFACGKVAAFDEVLAVLREIAVPAPHVTVIESGPTKYHGYRWTCSCGASAENFGEEATLDEVRQDAMNHAAVPAPVLNEVSPTYLNSVLESWRRWPPGDPLTRAMVSEIERLRALSAVPSSPAPKSAFPTATEPCASGCAAAGPVTHVRGCPNHGKWPARAEETPQHD